MKMMLQQYNKLVLAFFWVLAALIIMPAHAAEKSAKDTVQTATTEMLAVIKKSKSSYKKSPGQFYSQLLTVLEPVVAFEEIARSVMTRKYLSKDRPTADKQVQQFTKAFKMSMVEFYGKALLRYDNEKIVVHDVKPAKLKKKRVPVDMTIYTSGGVTFPLTYTMFIDKKADQWKMRNVIVNGINVGKLFRTQFAEAMQQNKGNLQQVISNWSDIMKTAHEKGKS